MKLRKVILSLVLLCLVLGVSIIGVSAATIVDRGKCGDNVSWTLDSAGTLTISGTGKMYDYGGGARWLTPWYRYPLTKVVIKPGITYIGADAFSPGSPWFDPELPDEIERSLTSVSIPNTVTEIGASAFSNNFGLPSIRIPNGVTKIGERAFANCDALKSITIPDSVKELGVEMLNSCAVLAEVKLPKGLKEIPRGLFSASGIRHIEIPAGVTRIPKDAFAWCFELQEITIPKSVVSIEENAFSNCWGLKWICFRGNAPAIYKNVFDGDNAYNYMVNAKVYYPKGNKTWTANKQQNYGGRLAWIAVSAPKITAQPKMGIAGAGEEAQTTVRAAGAELTYTWYYKNAGGKKFNKAAQTENTYTATMNNASRNRTVYCVVTDVMGNTVKSSAVQLRMSATVSAYPTSAAAAAGQNAKLTVRAVGDGLTYKWYYKNPNAAKFRLSSVTGSTYTVKMQEKLNGQQVYCVVRDKYGKTAKTDVAEIRCKVTPKIITQPKTTRTPRGEEASVSVMATGVSTYQWYYKNVGDKAFTKAKNQTGETYRVTMNNTSKDRIVYCVLTSGDGVRVTTQKAVLRMEIDPVKITKDPLDRQVAKGQKITLSVTATGDGLTYQWYYASDGENGKKISGATSRSYTFQVKNFGHYFCVVKDQYGNMEESKWAYVYS